LVDLRQKMANEHSRNVAKATHGVITAIQSFPPHMQIMAAFVAAHVLLRHHGMGIRDIHDISTNYIDGWINTHPENQAITDTIKDISSNG
jgi:hypothetical protein